MFSSVFECHATLTSCSDVFISVSFLLVFIYLFMLISRMLWSTSNRKRFIMLAMSCSSEALLPMSAHARFASHQRIGTLPLRNVPNHTSYGAGLRLFSYQNGGNQDDDSSFLSKVGNTVKSVLPTRWFGSDEEKLKVQRRKDTKQQMSSSLNEVLKDAPLGFRMMGKMMGPLFSAAASTIAETLAEQQHTNEAVLGDAQIYIQSDPAVTALLGNMIQVGAPYSQASSSTIINGVKQSRVELQMPVSGQAGSGIAKVVATQDGIAQLQVEAAGHLINVDTSKERNPSRGYKSIDPGDDIIEAEIVDKKRYEN